MLQFYSLNRFELAMHAATLKLRKALVDTCRAQREQRHIRGGIGPLNNAYSVYYQDVILWDIRILWRVPRVKHHTSMVSVLAMFSASHLQSCFIFCLLSQSFSLAMPPTANKHFFFLMNSKLFSSHYVVGCGVAFEKYHLPDCQILLSKTEYIRRERERENCLWNLVPKVLFFLVKWKVGISWYYLRNCSTTDEQVQREKTILMHVLCYL